jgi:hypothetical protein
MIVLGRIFIRAISMKRLVQQNKELMLNDRCHWVIAESVIEVYGSIKRIRIAKRKFGS